MFLIVFVTLVISIIGLFAQILSAQTAALYKQQVGFMQTMTIWHGAAVSVAHANQTIFSAAPCRLTAGTVNNGGPPVCTVSVGLSNLPPGYQTTPYTFYSVAYQTAAGGDYVITFVHDSDSNGNLKLPDSSGRAVGYTAKNLMQQLARAASSYLYYGTVTSSTATSGVLTVYTKSNDTTTPGSLAYTIPGSSVIPLNSVALISAAQ